MYSRIKLLSRASLSVLFILFASECICSKSSTAKQQAVKNGDLSKSSSYLAKKKSWRPYLIKYKDYTEKLINVFASEKVRMLDNLSDKSGIIKDLIDNIEEAITDHESKNIVKFFNKEDRKEDKSNKKESSTPESIPWLRSYLQKLKRYLKENYSKEFVVEDLYKKTMVKAVILWIDLALEERLDESKSDDKRFKDCYIEELQKQFSQIIKPEDTLEKRADKLYTALYPGSTRVLDDEEDDDDDDEDDDDENDDNKDHQNQEKLNEADRKKQIRKRDTKKKQTKKLVTPNKDDDDDDDEDDDDDDEDDDDDDEDDIIKEGIESAIKGSSS